MKFGYTVLYVPHLENALSFYEKAFGLTRKFVAESGFYGELDTGETTLSFCEEDRLTSEAIPFHPSRPEAAPPAMEIAFVTSEVEEKYQQAIAAGATPVRAPKEAPWGQKVAYVRDLNGVLVEICSPI
jgi:lactoylglutathione lyase